MDRQEILDQYSVNEHGTIVSPGKFEGEKIYVPYFWEMFLEGAGDEDEDGSISFEVQPEDRDEFPELGRRTAITLREDSQGFVCEP